MRAPRLGRLGVAGFVVLCIGVAPAVAGASPDVLRIAPASSLSVQQARLTLTPASGAPGASVTAKISGFKPFEYVNFRWMSPIGPPVAATVMADASGRAIRFITVPSVKPATYTVYAVSVSPGVRMATAKLTVT